MTCSEDGRRAVDSPIWISAVEKTPPRPRAPEIGEHGRDVLAEGGYDDARIAARVAAGVARDASAR